VIIADMPPQARVYRALPTGDVGTAALSGDVVLMAREHYDDLVARVALLETAAQLRCSGVTP
jgi:hypothetical protein